MRKSLLGWGNIGINGWFNGASGNANTALLISGNNPDILNRYVDVSFDPNVYHSTGGGLLVADLAITNFQANGGTSLTITITSVTTTSGGALSGGEQTVRVNLSITGNATGVESFEIQPSASGTYRDNLNNYVSAADTTGAIVLQVEYDAMYKAGLAVAITNDLSIPPRLLREVHNDWFVSARSNSYLTEFDGIHICNYGDLALIDFVSATVRAAEVGTPDYSLFYGVRGATNSYFDLNYDPATNSVKFLQNDCSVLLGVSNNGATNGFTFGSRNNALPYGNVQIKPRASDQAVGSLGNNSSNNSTVILSVTDSKGVHFLSREANNLTRQYINGTQLDTDADLSSALNSFDFYLCSQNQAGTAGPIDDQHYVTIIAWGSGMQDKVSEISTDVNALIDDSIALAPTLSGRLYSWLGQSNMDRAELLTALSPGQAAIYVDNGAYSMANGYDANCYVWWDDEWQFLEPGVNGVDKAGGYFSPLYAYALAEAAKYPGENLFFVHQAIGGSAMETATPLPNWYPGGNSNSIYNQYLDKYTNAVAALTSVTAYMPALWGQGEADARALASANEYEANEQLFAAGIFADTSHTEIIVMDIHADSHPATYPYVTTVKTAKANNLAGGEYGAGGALIDIDDLSLQSDDTHLTNTGSITMAQRLSAAS